MMPALNRYNPIHVQKVQPYDPGPDLINCRKTAAGKWQDMTPSEMALQRREGGKPMAVKLAATIGPAEAQFPAAPPSAKQEAASSNPAQSPSPGAPAALRK